LYFLHKKFTILELFAKPFPTESKPSKCPTKEKENGERKAKEAESKKRKSKNVKDEGAAKVSRKKNAHARTLKAVICLQERKLV